MNGPVDAGQFWATVAQVMPALGVGLVIELRWLRSQITALYPRTFVAIQYLLWTVALGALGLCEILAFMALGTGHDTTDSWSSLAILVIVIAVMLLIVNPAIEFLMGALFYLRRMARVFIAVLKLAVDWPLTIKFLRNNDPGLPEFRRIQRRIVVIEIENELVADRIDRASEEGFRALERSDLLAARQEIIERQRAKLKNGRKRIAHEKLEIQGLRLRYGNQDSVSASMFAR